MCRDKTFWILTLFLLVSFSSLADESKNAFKLYIENDLGSSDQSYTHGTRIEWQSLDYRTPTQVDDILLDYLLWQKRDYTKRSWCLSQNIYTPKDIGSRWVVLDDRPYAGWLYVGYSVEESDKDISDSFEMQAGIVGPWALAGETQILVHEIGGFTIPQGWDNQLNNELALNILRNRAYRFGLFSTSLLDADLISKNSVCLGNVFTYAESGLMVRTGKNLPGSFGDFFMSPRETSVDIPWFGLKWSDIYLFVGVNGRIVGRNIFLDGNTFSDSHSIEKKLVVGEVYHGIALKFRRFDFMLASTIRSIEFDTEDHSHKFNSLSVAVLF